MGAVLGVPGHQWCRGCQGVLGADRDSRYSGARRDIGALGAPRGVGIVRGPFWGCQGASGDVGVYREW